MPYIPAKKESLKVFDALRSMDDAGVQVIVAGLPEDKGGIVPALKNRMLKAAGGRVVSESVTTRVERI